MVEIRSILLFGRTGSGKSALANILSGTKKFKESEDSVSETREIGSEVFEYQGVKYKVIDTVGFGDTKLKSKEVLNIFANACREVSEGLNQIFLIIGGKFTEEELETYNLLKQTVFDEDIYSYTTIVRTKFADFEDEKRCQEDREKISQENEKLAELIRVCNEIIHVDNPPVKGRSAATNKEIREISRDKLLEHLIHNCSNYRPVSLDRINERISSYMTEKEQIQKELRNLQIKMEEERRESDRKMAEMEANIEAQHQKTIDLEKKLEEKIDKKFEETIEKLIEGEKGEKKWTCTIS